MFDGEGLENDLMHISEELYQHFQILIRRWILSYHHFLANPETVTRPFNLPLSYNFFICDIKKVHLKSQITSNFQGALPFDMIPKRGKAIRILQHLPNST